MAIPVAAMTPGALDARPEFASAAIRDSRRLMGPNRFSDDPGAVIDVVFAADDLARADEFIAAWRLEATALARPLGWTVSTAWRRSPDGASCFVAVPVDALLTGTELNEQAWARGEGRVRPSADAAAPAPADGTELSITLRTMADAERAPHLAALVTRARARHVTVLDENDALSLGTGDNTQLWWHDQLPDVDAVEWELYDRIPITMVTGSNGKTTTVRMLAAILRKAVGTVAMSSTTGVYVDGKLLDGGDYSGPAGARMALRDPRARAAVLETARGGILRRGLALYEADVAIVTNVAADHFGDYGIHDLSALGEVKLVVARAVRDSGTLVLNAEDPTLRALGPATRARVVWFSVDPSLVEISPEWLAAADQAASWTLSEAAEAGMAAPPSGQLWRAAEAWTVLNGHLVRRSAVGDEVVMAVGDIPATFEGAARYNVANALAAAAAASALGVPMRVVAEALSAFGQVVADNPGRLERYEVGGVTVVLDYAHNAAAVTALLSGLASMPARRRAVVIGTGGDRQDDALRAMARAAWGTAPVDLVIAKELPGFARGRDVGSAAAAMVAELQAAGAAAHQVRAASDEPSAVAEVMAWAKPGDLVVITVHESREAVLAQLGAAGAAAPA